MYDISSSIRLICIYRYVALTGNIPEFILEVNDDKLHDIDMVYTCEQP